MNKNSMNKTKWLHIRMDEAEYEAVRKFQKETTCQTLSEFIRRKIADEAFTVMYRNRSMDDLIAQLILLRADLLKVARNYNQVVKKMNAMTDCSQLEAWMLIHDNTLANVTRKIDETRQQFTEIFERWSRS